MSLNYPGTMVYQLWSHPLSWEHSESLNTVSNSKPTDMSTLEVFPAPVTEICGRTNCWQDIQLYIQFFGFVLEGIWVEFLSRI